jgi:hypothetical protein
VRERLAAAAAGAAPGRYQILSAINAVRASARDMRDTRRQISLSIAVFTDVTESSSRSTC